MICAFLTSYVGMLLIRAIDDGFTSEAVGFGIVGLILVAVTLLLALLTGLSLFPRWTTTQVEKLANELACPPLTTKLLVLRINGDEDGLPPALLLPSPHLEGSHQPPERTQSNEGGGQTSLLCVRSEALSALRASALLCAGIARLRGSAALLVASSSMIGASIEGYLAYRDRCQCHPTVVSEKGSAHRG